MDLNKQQNNGLFQLEESEFTCAAAVKARKSMEVEIEDLHVQMEDISKTKQAVSKTLCSLFSSSKSSRSKHVSIATQCQAAVLIKRTIEFGGKV